MVIWKKEKIVVNTKPVKNRESKKKLYGIYIELNGLRRI
jgi:hypothetical protein